MRFGRPVQRRHRREVGDGAQPLHHRGARRRDLAMLIGHDLQPAGHGVQQLAGLQQMRGGDGRPKRWWPWAKVS